MQKHSWMIEKAQQGVRLDRFLLRALAAVRGRGVSEAQVREVLEAGAVLLNGKPERNGAKPLYAGSRVEVVGDGQHRDRATAHVFRTQPELSVSFGPAQILFEDEWLIAVSKPVGVPTQPTLDEKRTNLFGLLKQFLRARDGAEPYVGLHHRLDRDTSGVVLFTKKQEANAGVTALFSSRAVQKTYQALAVVGDGCPDAWDVRNHLGVVSRVGKANKFGAVRSGGDVAYTSFVVKERFAQALLVEAQPHTGRTHQIRVHLAEGGHAILGDPFYGGPAEVNLGGHGVLHVDRVMLHAGALTFPHPITQAEVEVSCPLPADFAECVARLRG